LDFCRNNIGDSGAASLSDNIKVNTALTNLNLIDNVNVYSGVAFLSDALKGNTSLTNLNF